MSYETLKEDLRQDVAGACAAQKTRNASRKLSRRYDDALRPLGLKCSQYSMLVIITLTEDRTLTELAGHVGLERTTLIRNLKPLEREGWVKVSEEGYRRARTVEITEQGLAKLEEALPIWYATQKSLKEELGEGTWQSVHQSLEALNRIN